MFPYADDTPSYSFPLWIVIIILANVLVFVMSVSEGDKQYLQTTFAYGTIPARFFQPSSAPLVIPPDPNVPDSGFTMDQSKMPSPFITLFTSMFLHGGLMHLLGNMWFLWIFGDNIEDRLGKLLFPIFYIVCGLCAGILHIILLHDSTVPAIGASGAIAGVMGAYLFMFPRSSVATLAAFGFFFTTIHIPSAIFLGLWFVLQFFGGLGGGAGIAFWAHVGGFIAGLVLAMIFSALRMVNWMPDDRGYTGGYGRRFPSQWNR
jgi:membrane associated rhomboid family serine protease